jgi:hypothetical protein
MIFGKVPSLSVTLQIVPIPTDIPSQMLLDGNKQSLQPVVLETVKGYYQLSGDSPWATMPFKVDTGAAVTVVKKSDWNMPARRRLIRWLHEPNVVAKPDGLPGKTYRMSGVGGGGVEVYFGRVCLCFFKASQPNNPILNLCLVAAFDAEGKLNNTLLGLGGESFKNGGLALDGQTRTVHLVRF